MKTFVLKVNTNPRAPTMEELLINQVDRMAQPFWQPAVIGQSNTGTMDILKSNSDDRDKG